MDLTRLATGAGLHQTTLTQAMRDTARHSFSQQTILRLSDRYGEPVPPGLLQRLPPGRSRRGDKLPPSLMPTATGAVEVASADEIAVQAVLMIGRGPFFHLNPTPSEWVPRPSSLVRSRGIAAFRAGDSSMAPWRQPDELVLVDPARAISPGCHAVIPLLDPKDQQQPEMHLLCRITGPWVPGEMPPLELYNPPKGFALGRLQLASRPKRVLEWQEVALGIR